MLSMQPAVNSTLEVGVAKYSHNPEYVILLLLLPCKSGLLRQLTLPAAMIGLLRLCSSARDGISSSLNLAAK